MRAARLRGRPARAPPLPPPVPCSEGEEDDISEDLDAAMRSLQALTAARGSGGGGGGAPNQERRQGRQPSAPPPGTVTRRPEVIDDFIRCAVEAGAGLQSCRSPA